MRALVYSCAFPQDLVVPFEKEEPCHPLALHYDTTSLYRDRDVQRRFADGAAGGTNSTAKRKRRISYNSGLRFCCRLTGINEQRSFVICKVSLRVSVGTQHTMGAFYHIICTINSSCRSIVLTCVCVYVCPWILFFKDWLMNWLLAALSTGCPPAGARRHKLRSIRGEIVFEKQRKRKEKQQKHVLIVQNTGV